MLTVCAIKYFEGQRKRYKYSRGKASFSSPVFLFCFFLMRSERVINCFPSSKQKLKKCTGRYDDQNWSRVVYIL